MSDPEQLCDCDAGVCRYGYSGAARDRCAGLADSGPHDPASIRELLVRHARQPPAQERLRSIQEPHQMPPAAIDPAEWTAALRSRCVHADVTQQGDAGCSCSARRTPTLWCQKHQVQCSLLSRSTDGRVRFSGSCADFQRIERSAPRPSATVHTVSTVPAGPRQDLVAPCLEPQTRTRRRYEGCAARKPWEYRVQLVMAHLDTPEPVRMAVELWRAQTVSPLIVIVDTGSSPENLAAIHSLEADDVEVHSIRARGYRHSSGPVAAALDLAAGLCQQEFQFHTHTDVFPRRRDLLEWMLSLCGPSQPVVGYEMSPRDFVNPVIAAMWRGMVGHTATMLHWPTIDRHSIRWHMEAAHSQFGVPRDPMNNTDTETAFNLRLKAAGIVPHFVGHDTNFERYMDDNIDHFRSFGGSLLYDRNYHRKAMEWMSAAMREAEIRLREWQAVIRPVR